MQYYTSLALDVATLGASTLHEDNLGTGDNPLYTKQETQGVNPLYKQEMKEAGNQCNLRE